MVKNLVEQKIKALIANTLGLKEVEVELSHPLKEKFGDFFTNLPIRATKSLRQSANEIAKNLLDILYKSELSELMEKIEIAGPGFINFYLKTEILGREAGRILREGRNYGHQPLLSSQKIMVEFAHPNPFKEFHIGHLRNIALGESLVRLNEALGAKVIRVNYQGDVGLHVAKALWGINHLGLIGENEPLLERIEFLGKAYVAGHNAYEEGKAEVMEINKKIYAKDPSVFSLWEKTRAWSLEYFDSIYRRLGTHYDRLFFESEVAQSGLEIARQALKQGVLKASEGAVIFDGTPYGLDKRVFLTGEDLPTYEAKELGLAELEFSEFGAINKCLHVVGPEQQSFFRVTFKVEELLDPAKYASKQYHFVYGYVRLKEGKMSSRAGNVVTALSIIEAAKAEVRNMIKLPDLSAPESEKIAEKVAVAAVKYSLLKTDAQKDIAFSLKESISLEGNSGPYLQYTYARARSVLRRAVENGEWKMESLDNFQLSTFNFQLGPEETTLLRTFYKFPEVVEAAASNYSPHLICNFLFDLAQKFNLFYNNVSIISGKLVTRNSKLENVDSISQVTDYELLVTRFRLALTAATAQILHNGLYLLGIEAPERM